MADLNKVFNALADNNRRQILLLLRNGSMNAGDIASHFNISKPSITFHLKTLRDAELVSSRKEGQNVIYSLNASVFESVMLHFMKSMNSTARSKGKKK